MAIMPVAALRHLQVIRVMVAVVMIRARQRWTNQLSIGEILIVP